jgi:DNA polymerase
MTDWAGGRKVVLIDFETYYDDDYSLKRMSVEEYVDDGRFHVHGMGYWSEATGPGFVWSRGPARRKLEELGVQDPNTLTLAHNMAFDGFVANSICREHGFEIAMPVCTIAMARFTPTGRRTALSLKALARHFHLAEKGDIGQFKGRTFEDFKASANRRREMEDYCNHDVSLTRILADEFGPQLTDEALKFIALSLRMYISPLLKLDVGLLEQYRAELVKRQDEGVERLQRMFDVEGRDHFLSMLRSRDRFAEMLTSLGAEIPMKVSKAKEKSVAEAEAEARGIIALAEAGTPLDSKTVARGRRLVKTIRAGALTPALAKSDLGFMRLMESEDEDVAELCRLRAENNSSIALSRADAFLGVARRGSPLPVPLSPYRAVTGRYAAGNEGGGSSDRLNLQNLPKRTGDVTLRKAIMAPEGHVLVAGDSSQIEARVGAWLAGQADLLDTFRRGEDPYVEMASHIYGMEYERLLKKAKEEKVPEYVTMRNVGKETILSSQYGISGVAFGRRLLQQRVRLAPDDEGHFAEAQRINRIYRARFRQISEGWWALDRFLRAVAQGGDAVSAASVCQPLDRMKVSMDGDALVIRLPNGFPLTYPELRTEDGRDVSYTQYGGFSSKPVRKWIYGGLLFNNLTQGTAFAVLAYQAVKISKCYRIVANVHDSWVICEPLDGHEYPWAKNALFNHLTDAPPWAEGLPLDAEVKHGKTYEVA